MKPRGVENRNRSNIAAVTNRLLGAAEIVCVYLLERVCLQSTQAVQMRPLLQMERLIWRQQQEKWKIKLILKNKQKTNITSKKKQKSGSSATQHNYYLQMWELWRSACRVCLMGAVIYKRYTAQVALFALNCLENTHSQAFMPVWACSVQVHRWTDGDGLGVG